MFTKGEGMGDIGMIIPFFSRPTSEPGLFELVDPSQQMHLWIFNFSSHSFTVRLWADGVEKQSYTLGPGTKEARVIGCDGSSQIQALILTCLPEFQNLADNPIVVILTGETAKEIKAEFQDQVTGEKTPLTSRFRFASPENAVPWDEYLKK